MKRPIVTDVQLNKCLLAVNTAYKNNELLNSNEISLEINKQLITFIFDKTLGRRGSWIPKTNIQVQYTLEDENT
jgi:hypothetical protein